MGFSRPEYWSGQPFPSPGDLPNPGIESRSLALQAHSLPSEPPGKPKNTGVGSLSLLRQILPTQESNQGLLHRRQILYPLSYEGSFCEQCVCICWTVSFLIWEKGLHLIFLFTLLNMTFTWHTLTNELIYFQLSAYVQCYLYLYAWWLSAETMEANSVITTTQPYHPSQDTGYTTMQTTLGDSFSSRVKQRHLGHTSHRVYTRNEMRKYM